jgi:regulator of cell morphogenesis and NO signaling
METATLGDIVSRDARAGAILDRYGLDYCCGGARSLAEGCAQRGLDVRRVVDDLEALDPGAREAPETDLRRLVDYIVTTHHAYIREWTPVIESHLAKVVAAHGDRHPELSAVRTHFTAVAGDLALHMAKEEQVLFPYICALARVARDDAPAPPDMFGTIQNPIRMMEIEHEEAGQLLGLVRELSAEYAPPADACATYRLVLTELAAFEADLHRHVHLENNVLFPRAVELEETIDRRGSGLKCERGEL